MAERFCACSYELARESDKDIQGKFDQYRCARDLLASLDFSAALDTADGRKCRCRRVTCLAR